MTNFLKHFIEFLQDFLGINHHPSGRNGSNYRLGLFHRVSWLAQGPMGSRSAPGGVVGSYSTQAAQTRRHKYSPEEVKRILRGLEKGDHAAPVLLKAATFGTLLDERMIRYFRGRERLFERLPYVLFQYTQGRPSQDIARSVSFFSDGDDVEEAMDFAARLITFSLNRQR